MRIVAAVISAASSMIPAATTNARPNPPAGQRVMVDRGPRRLAELDGPRTAPGEGGGAGAVRDDGEGDGAEHRQADRPAHLLAGVAQAGGHPGFGLGDLGHGDHGERDEQQAEADTGDQGGAEDRVQVAAVLAEPGQPVQAAAEGEAARPARSAARRPAEPAGRRHRR